MSEKVSAAAMEAAKELLDHGPQVTYARVARIIDRAFAAAREEDLPAALRNRVSSAEREASAKLGVAGLNAISTLRGQGCFATAKTLDEALAKLQEVQEKS